MATAATGEKGARPPRIWPERIFYGWMIVFISFLASMLSSGIASYGFGAFIRILSDPARGPGWSRASISLVSVFRNFSTLFAAPVLGRFADRKRGPQVLMATGALASGIVLLLLARSTQLWQFYLLFGVVWGVSMMALGGQILGPTVVSKWFVRKRGRALGIATMGVSAGGVIVIPITTLFIALFGWRGAWAALGVVILVTLLPLGAVFMRRQPEDLGLLPDGDRPEAAGAARPEPSRSTAALRVQGSFTVRQAFRARAF
jgi:MFS family permease